VRKSEKVSFKNKISVTEQTATEVKRAI
jgi:hypothetical protein